MHKLNFHFFAVTSVKFDWTRDSRVNCEIPDVKKFSKNTTFIKNTNWAIRAYYAGNWHPNIFVPIPQYVRKLIPSEAA